MCRLLKRQDNHIYHKKNLHATVVGFGPMKKVNIKNWEKIQEFTKCLTGTSRSGLIMSDQELCTLRTKQLNTLKDWVMER